MSLLTSAVARVSAPTKTGITATEIAKDVTTWGGPIIALITSLAASGAVSIPAGWLSVINAVVALLPGLASARHQQTVADVKASAAVAAAKAAA